MRRAVISDLHLEERKDPSPLRTPEGMFPIYGSVSLPREIDADVMAIAGDPSPDPVVRAEVLDWIRNELGIPVVTSTGTTTTAAAHSRTTWATSPRSAGPGLLSQHSGPIFTMPAGTRPLASRASSKSRVRPSTVE